MAKVICDMKKCKHRSKKPMRSFQKRSGKKCYGCMIDAVQITRIFDPDGDVREMLGETEMAHCLYYDPDEEPDEEMEERDEV